MKKSWRNSLQSKEQILVLGAPSILQSDNGREFANNVVISLKEIWLALQIVHGNSRDSSNQGSIEKANQDIENVLYT